jgi:hypothetical protein
MVVWLIIGGVLLFATVLAAVLHWSQKKRKEQSDGVVEPAKPNPVKKSESESEHAPVRSGSGKKFKPQQPQ